MAGVQRVLIIGSGGSGKSYLARQMGPRLGLPVIHLDPLFWKPGWVETPEPDWRAIQEQLVRRPRWIIDGNHASTLDLRLRAADTVVFLDMPRRLCLWRVVKRSLQHRGRDRIDRAEGCRERLNRSFLRWVWGFPKEGRDQVFEALARFGDGVDLIVLHHRQDIARFLERCRPEPSVTLVSPPVLSPARSGRRDR
jgi:adenylate kinase family enzyme